MGGWDEDASEIYRALAPVAVPDRAEQLAALACLLPFSESEPFVIVDAGCGEGALSSTLLEVFPAASVRALDGSHSMLRRAEATLAAQRGRFELHHFEVSDPSWLDHLDGAGALVSSLVVHHLDAPGKRDLFAQAHERLGERAAFLLADLIEPQRPEANRLFGATWDRVTAEQAHTQFGSPELFDRFTETGWNLFFNPDPEVDKPSGLFEQLRWLDEAGFGEVDCFWLRAGHAIYGGYKGEGLGAGVLYGDALAAAQRCLARL